MTGPTADQPQLRRDSGGEQVEPATPIEPDGGGPTGAAEAEDEGEEARTPYDGYRAL